MEYVVFSDESYISAERYRCIGSISMPVKYYKELNIGLMRVLKDSDVTEFKWKKLNNAKYKFCAEKFINFIIPEIRRKSIRIDVLMWDTFDSRHNIKRRDDLKNCQKMYFHLLKNLIKKRERDSKWNILTDEMVGIDWQTINDCLCAVGRKSESTEYPLLKENLSKRGYSIKFFKCIESHKYPFCQVADLFAGMSVFSINSYERYKNWEIMNSIQTSLFNTIIEDDFSNSEKVRFFILKHFISLCQSGKFGVSFNSNKRLHTPNPNNPINFWFYEPQTELDKAPTN